MSKKKAEPKKETDKILIENFVTLQKVLTNLAIKFDSLSERIDKLLELFEISAKSFAEKQKSLPDPVLMERKRDLREKDFIEKIDKLLDQNRVIAKGLTMLEERTRHNLAKQHQENTEEFYPRKLPRI
jgi:hypothetical protein